MNTKRIIAMLIAAIMVLSLVPVMAISTSAANEGMWTTYQSASAYEITDGTRPPESGYGYTDEGLTIVQPDWTGETPFVTVSSKEMLEAMMEPISEVLDTICSVIEKTPPELVGDILKNGIVLTGGGSMLYGIDRLIEDVTGIKTKVAKSPTLCVANGMIEVLKLMDEFSDQRIDLSKIKQKI